MEEKEGKKKRIVTEGYHVKTLDKLDFDPERSPLSCDELEKVLIKKGEISPLAKSVCGIRGRLGW